MQKTESISEFQRNPALYAEKLKNSKEPLVLMTDGRPELVVLDAQAYQELLIKVEFAETVQDLKEGVASFERGEGKPARLAFAELAEKHGISR